MINKKSHKVKNFDQLQKQLQEQFHLSDDPQDVLQYVTHNNYYVLGMYWYKFTNENKEYSKLSLEELQAPYKFDQELSHLILKHLLILENSLQSVIVNKLSVQAGHYWAHLDEKFLYNETNNALPKSIANIFRGVVNPTRSQVGRHYIEQISDINYYDKPKYGCASEYIDFDKKFNEQYENMTEFKNGDKNKDAYKRLINNTPLFVLVHFLDFRGILNLFKGMAPSLRTEVAKIYGCNCKKTFDKLIDCMICLRNRCSHPTRNYPADDYKNITEAQLNTLNNPDNNDVSNTLYPNKYIFRTLAVLQYFLKKIDPKNHSFAKELKILIQKQSRFLFPQYEKEVETIPKKHQKLLKAMGVLEPKQIWKENLWK